MNLSGGRIILIRLALTVVVSVLTGLLAAIWRYKILDPAGTGGSILAAPIIFTMFPICAALFFTGILTFNRSFGPFLVIASFLVIISFFVLNGLVQNLDNY